MFNIDFKRLVVYLLPFVMRRKRLVSFIVSFLIIFQQVYLFFRSNRDDNNKSIRVTPQICSLRKRLNDRFDQVEREIRIDDIHLLNRTYIYTGAEEQPKYLGEIFIYNASEMKNDEGFAVHVPERIQSQSEDAQLRAEINKYKLAGTKYTIIYE